MSTDVGDATESDQTRDEILAINAAFDSIRRQKLAADVRRFLDEHSDATNTPAKSAQRRA